jgi:hypothetical protein
MKGISAIGPWLLSALALCGVGFQEWRYQQLERKLYAMNEYTGRPNPVVQLAKLTARVDRLEAQQPPAPAPTAPAAPNPK